MSWPVVIILAVIGFVGIYNLVIHESVTKLRRVKKELKYQQKKNARLKMIETFKKFDVMFDPEKIKDMQLIDLMEGHFKRSFK